MKIRNWIRLMGMILFTSTAAVAVTDEEIHKIEQAMPAKAVVVPEKPRTLLVFNLSNGFKHSCIPYWQKALEIMAQKTGAFKVENSSDMSVFNAESLKAFDAICFNNTTGLTPDTAQQKAIMDFIQSGKGIVGIHAATDNFGNWLEGQMMMGGVFKGHPWTAGGTWAIKIDDPQHPLMKSFEGKGFKVNDEIYRTLPPQYSRANQRVLMSLDMSDPATRDAKGVTPEDADTGISWIKPVGKGRLFYCSLGHNHHLTWTKPVLEHYLAGIQYAMGDLKVDDTPLGAQVTVDGQKISSLIEKISRWEWDQSRAPLAEMEQIVRQHLGDTSACKLIEGAVLKALHSEATPAGKDFFCRTLAVIGTDDAVPTLTNMLTNGETFDIAVFALTKIPGQNADSALLGALGSAQDARQKAGLMTALGLRKTDSAVPVVAAAVADTNPIISQAAVEALAAIGTEEAAVALQKATVTDAGLNARIQDALLRCAYAMDKAGQTPAAMKIYQGLYADGNSPVIKAGALLGLAQTADLKAGEYTLYALQSDQAFLVRAGAKTLAQTADKALLEKASAMALQLSPQSQIELVTALSENKNRIGREAAEKLAGSPEKEVRIAAYQALAALGNEQSVPLLGRAAASAQDRDERRAAQESLYRLPGVDAAIAAGIGSETLDEAVRLELIRAADQRQSKQAVKALLQIAQSSNSKAADLSTRALQSLAGPEDVEALTMLVIKRPDSNTENALTAAATKINDRNQRAGALLKRYGDVKDPQSKASLLRVMGKVGDTHAVSLLNQEFRSTDPVISEAAFRAMSDWPGAEFTATMKEMAQNSPDTKNKVLAFRAYVRMLGTEAPALMEAYGLADRPDEKKVVIGALAGTDSEQALVFLDKLSEDPQFKSEAQMSLLAVCDKLTSSNSAAAAVLRKLRENGSTERTKRRASELLSK